MVNPRTSSPSVSVSPSVSGQQGVGPVGVDLIAIGEAVAVGVLFQRVGFVSPHLGAILEPIFV